MVIRLPDIVDLRIEKELTSILGNGRDFILHVKCYAEG